jgi:ureidoglycolate lyase
LAASIRRQLEDVAMPRTVEVKVEPLTEEAFKPFGAIIGASSRPPALIFDTMLTWKAPFEADGLVEVTTCRYLREPITWSRMERHLAVTQAFLPLSGVRSIMVVAPPTDQSHRDALPPPEAVRAFRMMGDVGVVLWRGIWHALRRFPLGASHIDIVLLTGRDTQSELERQAAGGPLPVLTHEADYQQLFDVSFCVIEVE